MVRWDRPIFFAILNFDDLNAIPMFLSILKYPKNTNSIATSCYRLYLMCTIIYKSYGPMGPADLFRHSQLRRSQRHTHVLINLEISEKHKLNPNQLLSTIFDVYYHLQKLWSDGTGRSFSPFSTSTISTPYPCSYQS